MRTRFIPTAAFALAALGASVLADGTWLGSSVCLSTPNSTGAAAVMGVFGPDHGGTGRVFLDDPVVLSAAPIPDPTLGLFFFGRTPTRSPFGNGYLCVASPSHRLRPTSSTSVGGGELTQLLTFADHPAFTPGTWYFQALYRDTPAGGASFDTSDSVELRISP